MKGISLLLLLCVGVAVGQFITLTYNDFTDLSGIQLNGNSPGYNPNTDHVLRLCTNVGGCAGGGFIKNSIPLQGPNGFKASFSAYFGFRIWNPSGSGDSDGVGADGIVFAINSVTSAFGGTGGGIGYQGMPKSVGVEFDTWNNGVGFGDPDGNHVAIDINGAFSAASLAAPVAKRMNDGDRWYSWIDFDGDTKTLEVRLSLTNTRPTAPLLSKIVDLVAVLGSPNVYVGFTSGTGGAQGIHDITFFRFTNQYAPLTTQDPTTQDPTTGTTRNPTTGTTQDPTTGTTANPCLDDGTYRTQAEGDYSDLASEGFEVGVYRDAHFATCFPHGLTVGCPHGHTIHFDASVDISNYLPQLGSPASLNQNYVNPTKPPPISTSSGNFGGQVTALALSLGFSSCDRGFHSDCGRLDDLFICDNRCERCKRNDGPCGRNSQIHCKFVREEEEVYEMEDDITEERNKNNNDGKPKYPNCEAFYGYQISDVFAFANNALGGCGGCGYGSPSKKNNKNSNCVRNSQCKKSEEVRNNKNCSRNKNCKKNKNCCCCVDQSNTPACDPVVLNNCVTLINQAFIFGKHLSDVDSGNLFKEDGCYSGSGAQET